MKKTFLLLLLVLFNVSCGINTEDPEDSFEYWLGIDVPNDVKMIKGTYWKSTHWTYEYVTYLKFKTTDEWWNEFIKQNNLILIHDNKVFINEGDNIKKWFTITNNCKTWSQKDDFQHSRYYRDTITKISYIHEIQL